MANSCQSEGVISPIVGPTIVDVCGGSQLLIFLGILSQYFNRQCDLRDPGREPKSNYQPNCDYDYIVVGSGAGGSVIASRLSANPANRVLLIEATDLQVPALFYPFGRSTVDWGYFNEPNGRAFLGAPGQRVRWTRGKMLGGTSGLNGLVYMRGNPHDYNEWSDLGNSEWSWPNVLPYFVRSEDHRNVYAVDSGFHGQHGPLAVSSPQPTQLARDLLQAGQERGLLSTDLNGRNQTGIMVADLMTKNGVRWSAARAFLRPVLQRRNLHLLLDTEVTRILLMEGDNRAYGVLATSNGTTQAIRARKEVIISAGTEQSPKLLLQSGIGSLEELQPWNITQRVALPGVGANLQNHVAVGVTWQADNLSANRLNWDVAREYMAKRTGSLATMGTLMNVKFASKYAANPAVPDVQLQISDNFVSPDAICQKSGTVSTGPDRLLITAYVIAVKPASRGRISLGSADPLAPPRIHSNELGADEDIEVLVDGVHRALDILQAPALAAYNLTLLRSAAGVAGQPCGVFTFPSDEYWRCVIRYNTIQYLHPGGTCKMGPADDTMAVVDQELRVHGTRGLRVVDGSIMPTLVAGNPTAPIVMIGEKAADSILRDGLHKNAAIVDLD